MDREGGQREGLSPRSSARWRAVTLAVVLFALANALYSAWSQGWTYDEPFNLEWSERLLTSRNADREITHFNSKTPATVPNAVASLAMRRAAATERPTRLAARLPSVAWLALLLATVYALGRALFGTPAACLATVAAALDPNLVAHGSVATVDLAYALASLWTVAAALAVGARPSAGRAALLGLALGLALTVKFTAILLLPVLLALPALRRPPRRDWPRWLVGAFVVAAVAVLTVCAAYLFVDLAQPLGVRRWSWRPLRRVAHALPWLRLPLPAAFLTGYDVSLAAERGDWNVVLLSRSYPHGVWFYFAVLWLLKTPLLVLLSEGWGLARSVGLRLGGGALGARLLTVALLVHLAYFSFLFRTQVGYRFVLMCVPIAYLLAAAGLAPLLSHRRAPWAGIAVLVVAVLENGLYFGNPLSFTNALVWPKRQAFRLMADSNLDWGQHDEAMEHRHRRPGAKGCLNPLHLLPGRDVFSVNEVAGVDDFEQHRFLRENADPSGHVGHTHVWFDVDDLLWNRFMDERRRLEPSAPGVCPAGPANAALSPGSPGRLSLPGLTDTRRSHVVCVFTPRGADLGLVARRGRVVFAPYREAGTCDGERVAAGRESWHRLRPGTHALCVAEDPSPDGALAPPFEGSWLVARGKRRSCVLTTPPRRANVSTLTSRERVAALADPGPAAAGGTNRDTLRVAVVGAGVTGLATAYLLLRRGVEVTVFEASPHEGGLAGSFHRDGFYFDFGPHELTTANQELIAFVRETCGDDLIAVEKRIAHHFLGRYVRYPFEVVDLVRNIGPGLGLRAVAEVTWCRLRNRLRDPADDSFESWTNARFGRTLYGLYFGPYTRKVWGIDPALLDPRTASQRVTIDSIWDLVRKTLAYRWLGAEDFKHTHSELHRRFFYLRRGAGTLQAHLRRRAEDLGGTFRFGKSLSGIERDGEKVRALAFADGEVARGFDTVVSTIPLSRLVTLALPGRAEALLRENSLPFRGMAFVFLRVSRPKVLDYHWVYYSDSRVPFQRMTEFGRFGAEMSPPGTTGLALEVSCTPGDGTWEEGDAEIAERSIAGLEKLRVLRRDEVIGYDVVRQRYAYPIQVQGFAEKAQRLLTALSEVKNLVTIGRQGLFRYCNMNECIEMAMDVAPEIASGKTAIRYTKDGSWLGVGLTDRYLRAAV